MNEVEAPRRTSPAAPPLARVRRHRRDISWIWAVPLITLLIAGYLAWNTLSNRGPLITITFQTAAGVTAGQTRVRHKEVEIGIVDDVQLSEDLKRVVITARMNPDARKLLTSKAQFWVVRPRFFAGTISGLSTLVSGSYIEVGLSGPGGQPERHFTGLETPPVLQSEVPGRTFLLRADRLGSLSVGSPVFYRDLDVGQVLGWDVADMAEYVVVHAFVRAPFDQYVQENTRFWNASGVSARLSGAGLQIQMQSLRALALGGIAFETPEGEAAQQAKANEVFPLYPDKESAETAGFGPKIPFVAFFEQSVGGVSPGTPVNLRGIKIGEVTRVSLRYDAASDRVVAPVRFEVQPERVAGDILGTEQDPTASLQAAVQRGLRAQLVSTNLITGGMAVSLDFFPDAKAAELQQEGAVYVIPTLPGGSQDIMRAVGQLMARASAIPLDQIGQNLNNMIKGLNQVANAPEIRQSLTALQATLTETQATLKSLNQGLQPAVKRLPDMTAKLDQTLTGANRLLGSLGEGYGGDSQFHRDLTRMMAQLTDALQSLRALADLLTRHPEALIRGRTNTGLQ